MKYRALISSILILSIIFALTSCAKEKNIEYCELGLVLTKDFETYDSEGVFDAAYSDKNAIVGFTRYSFVDCIEYGFLSTLTPLKFAETYLRKTEKENVEIFEDGDIPYYFYTSLGGGEKEYFYFLAFYRTPYAYFVITFIAPAEKQSDMKEVFIKYAKTAYILEEHI